MSEVKTPWKPYMGDVPMHLDYFQGSMFDAVERIADMYPNNIAFDFMGRSVTCWRMYAWTSSSVLSSRLCSTASASAPLSENCFFTTNAADTSLRW